VFLVGIFGVQFKAKSLIVEQGVICPCCGAYDRYEVLKTFNYFHIFFIPVWRWNKHYYIRTRCCSQTSELRQDVGERIERGERVQITNEHLVHSQPTGRNCPNCRASLERTFNFCPHCGTQLE
jgi:RNA polymerase subunit RPABC4/transcription elongation factor Spt4